MPKRKQDSEKGKASPKMKRASTMENTASEGNEFLAQEAPSLVDVPAGKSGVETRGKQQARSTLDSLLSKKVGLTELSEADKKKEENKIKMVFRLFDKDKDGFLDADELADAMRSCGKKPLKTKINEILKSVAQSKKNEAISLDEFTQYMLKKLFKEKKEKKEEKKEEKEEEAEAATPEKGKKGKKAAAKKSPAPKKSPAAKKGKGAKAEEKEEKEEEKKDVKGKGKAEPEAKPMERTRSITEFYTEHAGLNNEITPEKLDAYSNPAGVEFDLGLEGAFNGFHILIGSFIAETREYFSSDDFEKYAKPPLLAKGFQCIYTTKESEFLAKLPTVDLAWIVSSSVAIPDSDAFVEGVRKFHESGGGLFIWGENSPFYVHANAVLDGLLGMKLAGNTPAHKNLTCGDPNTSGHFGSHLITSGIKNLFEGRTVCYPEKKGTITQTIATSSDGHPVILAAEQGPGKLKDTQGRIVVDCGFTKLFVNWDTAGTARYVVNSNVWLLGLDHKMRHGLPLSRVSGEN